MMAQPSISFDAADGLELLYRVGGFEGNLARGMTMMWVRLLFLGALGLMAGVYLGFPTACLLALMVCIASVGSGYIAESLQGYASFGHLADASWWDQAGEVGKRFGDALAGDKPFDALKIVIRLVGSGFVLLVPKFGVYNPTPLLADGRWIPPRLLAEAALWVGVIWTGVVALIAYLVFRRRELARVTV